MCNGQIVFELVVMDIFLQKKSSLVIINMEQITVTVTDMLKEF